MSSLQRLCAYIIIAIAIWLADALLLSLIGEMTFISALWDGASQARLLMRLILVLVVLTVGFTQVLRREIEYMKVMQMNAADRSALFGAAGSAEKSQRMLFYALRLATLMKMSVREQDRLRKLCYCYDIGMVGVPSDLEEREAGLSDQEQEIRDQHIVLGAEIAANIPALTRIAPLIAAHEERYDGGGFRSLYGKSIPLACRIFTLVMMFDAYTHPRRGWRAMDTAEALDELEMLSGSVVDPEVMEAFRSLFNDRRLASMITARVYMQ